MSCATKYNVQKRHYNKGFYWAKSHKNNVVSNLHSANKRKFLFPQENLSKAEAPQAKPNIEMAIPMSSESVSEVLTDRKLVVLVAKKYDHKTIAVKSQVKYNKKRSNLFVLPDKDKNVPGTALFVLVCILAGLFAVAGIGYLMLFLATSANAYLLFALASGLLSALFFVIMRSMNQVE